jgi:hypothetical protein
LEGIFTKTGLEFLELLSKLSKKGDFKMASTTIDTRGTVDSSSGTGLTVSVPAVFAYLPETSVQAIAASGSIVNPGVYTINNATAAGVYLPSPASVPGGIIVFRTLGTAGQQHFLTGSASDNLGKFMTNGTSNGSKLTIGGTVGHSVSLISDGLSFCVTAVSGTAPAFAGT